jgi:hypothetical protein
MANPTTNYGFVLPTATDLVTDLPADFDVALQGVDTRLKALQPGTTLGDLAYSSATANTNTRLGIGTTGQVLTVASGVPSWATPTAGMTNPMTTTGDTIYSSSGSTPARLGIGSTGNVLTVSGGVPVWSAPASGGMTLLSTTSMSGSSTSVTSISGAYNTLFILVNYGLGTTSGVVSATLNSATSNYLMVFSRQDTTTNGGATASIPINAGVSQQDSGDGSVCQSAISIYNYASTSTNKPIQFGGNFRTGTSTQGINGAGTYVSTSAITSFQINTSAGTLEGTIRIYGVK